jgi:hypothetical protein
MSEEGFIESNPFVYDQIKQLGVRASVWDDVLDELFDQPFGSVADPFGNILFDLQVDHGSKWLDYSRSEGISDHDYVRGLLRQSIEQIESESSRHPELRPDDGSDCAEALEAFDRETRNHHQP